MEDQIGRLLMNLGDINLELLAIVSIYTAAITSGVRDRFPRINGPWVLLLVLISAVIATMIFAVPEIPLWVKYPLLAWSGAVGGISLADRYLTKKKETSGHGQRDS